MHPNARELTSTSRQNSLAIFRIAFGDLTVVYFRETSKNSLLTFFSFRAIHLELSSAMRINEKTLLTFANSKPVDKEGYLMKRGEGSYLRSESGDGNESSVPISAHLLT